MIVLTAALIALIGVFRGDLNSVSSERLPSCVWQTNCWHQQFLDQYVRDGLIEGASKEGDFLGRIAYRMEAISTQDLFTFFSILFSVLVFLAGLQYGRLQQRREHTLDVIMGIFHSDALAKANVHMAFLNLEVEAGNRTIDGKITGEDDRAVITILDYYEFICQGVYEGSLSKSAVLEVRGGAMKTTYYACQKYITDRRDSLGRKRLYWAFEKFVLDEVGNREY